MYVCMCVYIHMGRGEKMTRGAGGKDRQTDRLSDGKTLPKLPKKIIMFSQDYWRKLNMPLIVLSHDLSHATLGVAQGQNDYFN